MKRSGATFATSMNYFPTGAAGGGLDDNDRLVFRMGNRTYNLFELIKLELVRRSFLLLTKKYDLPKFSPYYKGISNVKEESPFLYSLHQVLCLETPVWESWIKKPDENIELSNTHPYTNYPFLFQFRLTENKVSVRSETEPFIIFNLEKIIRELFSIRATKIEPEVKLPENEHLAFCALTPDMKEHRKTLSKQIQQTSTKFNQKELWNGKKGLQKLEDFLKECPFLFQ